MPLNPGQIPQLRHTLELNSENVHSAKSSDTYKSQQLKKFKKESV